MKNSFTKNFSWIYFLSRRFSSIDKSSRFALTRIIPAIGIGFGVMALIVIISVMNGFQNTSINGLMEISSYHIRVSGNEKFDDIEFLNNCDTDSNIESVIPFIEAQGLLVGKKGKQQASLIRALPQDIIIKDKGFAEELDVYSGEFDLSEPMSICLGSDLAHELGVKVGDKISILALSGGSDVDLFSQNRVFTVKGLFYCTYSEINSLFSFISLEDGNSILGSNSQIIYGLKLKDSQKDAIVINNIKEKNSNCECESWREYNRSFFGALRIEKNVLIMLVFLIFLVVAVNIFNGMRRMVFERREEICVLSALGANSKAIQSVFVLQGLIVGLSGAIPGMILGLLLSVRMESVFSLIADLSYWVQYFITMLISPEKIYMVKQNTMYLFYAEIPTKVNLIEVMYITIFGFLSSVISSWLASKKIMKFHISEVLRDE